MICKIAKEIERTSEDNMTMKKFEEIWRLRELKNILPQYSQILSEDNPELATMSTENRKAWLVGVGLVVQTSMIVKN